MPATGKVHAPASERERRTRIVLMISHFSRSRLFYRFSRFEANRLKRYALFIGGGIGVGIAAVIMAKAADLAQEGFRALTSPSPYLQLVISPAGFAFSVFLAARFFPGSEGSGIPQVIAARKLPIESVRRRRRLVSMKLAIAKILLLLLGLLSGGALGREGPTVQVGAAIMQAAGRFAPARQPGFLLAGGAAGVAAAFNTPLAGIVFAIEEMSRSFDVKASGLVIMTVLVAGLTAQTLLGDYTYFGSSYVVIAPGVQWLAVPAAGIVGGFMGGLFNRLNVIWAKGLPGPAGAFVRKHKILIAAALGLLVALIGLLTGTHVDGTGYEEARNALHQNPTTVSDWYGPAKFVATLASTMSTLPGGLFSPSLSIGAGLGVDIAHALDIETVGAVALLGMVAYLTGVIQAPITSFAIVAEMTQNHAMLLPLMLTAIIANRVSRFLAPEGLYHALARGLEKHLPQDRDEPPPAPRPAAADGT